jgi:ArsR family transcriptional regulator
MDSAALLDLLGNENRRRILRLLARKPCYVTEISEYLGVSPKAVIDHLQKLEDAGLVESRTDENRRKYFHIARNLRLEVNVSPYDFGTKSAYAASPSLDIARCRYVTIDTTVLADVQETLEPRRGTAADGSRADAIVENADVADADLESEPGEAPLSELATELDRLQEIEHELSLAQRWVQGRITGILDRLSETFATEADARLYTELLASLAGGRMSAAELSSRVDAPPVVVEEALEGLAQQGIVVENEGGWAIAD